MSSVLDGLRGVVHPDILERTETISRMLTNCHDPSGERRSTAGRGMIGWCAILSRRLVSSGSCWSCDAAGRVEDRGVEPGSYRLEIEGADGSVGQRTFHARRGDALDLGGILPGETSAVPPVSEPEVLEWSETQPVEESGAFADTAETG